MVAVIIFASILFLCKLEMSGENDGEFFLDQPYPQKRCAFCGSLGLAKKKRSQENILDISLESKSLG